MNGKIAFKYHSGVGKRCAVIGNRVRSRDQFGTSKFPAKAEDVAEDSLGESLSLPCQVQPAAKPQLASANYFSLNGKKAQVAIVRLPALASQPFSFPSIGLAKSPPLPPPGHGISLLLR